MTSPPTPRQRAERAMKRGLELFKARDWDHRAFQLPGGLLSSIQERAEEEIEAAVAEATERERETIKERALAWAREYRFNPAALPATASVLEAFAATIRAPEEPVNEDDSLRSDHRHGVVQQEDET